MSRIGLVGCGRWGSLVLRDLLSLGATVTVVVANNDHARAAAAAGAAAVVGSIRDLPGVDGIVVVTPIETHADVIDALLERGVPIFCEKPLCDDAARAESLARIAGGRLFVMDKWRYHRGVLELASIARSGELGPVVGLRTTRIGYSRHAGADCVWVLLPHDMAIAVEILGRVLPPRSAVADVSGNGLSGLVAVCADGGGPWHVAEVGARGSLRQRVVTLLCRDGTATLHDAYAGQIVITENPRSEDFDTQPRTTHRPIAEDMPLKAELAAFLAHVNGGPPPKSSVRDAADQVKAIVELRRLAGI